MWESDRYDSGFAVRPDLIECGFLKIEEKFGPMRFDDVTGTAMMVNRELFLCLTSVVTDVRLDPPFFKSISLTSA